MTTNERETMWWCLKRQVGVVGGWGNAVWCFDSVWRSARQLQAQMREIYQDSGWAAVQAEIEELRAFGKEHGRTS